MKSLRTRFLLPIVLFAIMLSIQIVSVPITVHASSIGPDLIKLLPPTVSQTAPLAFSQDVNITYHAATPGQAGTTCPPPPSTTLCFPKIVSMQYVVQFDSRFVEIDNSVCVTSTDFNTYCGLTAGPYAQRFAVQQLPTNAPCGVNFCANEVVVAGTIKQIFVASISTVTPSLGLVFPGGVHSTIHWIAKAQFISVLKGADSSFFWGGHSGVGGSISLHFSGVDTFYSTSSTSTIDPSTASDLYTPTDGTLTISPGWGAFQSLGGSSSFDPALCQSGPGTVELVVTGKNGAIFHNTFNLGFWSGWDTANGISTTAPSCDVLGGSLFAVVRGANGAIFFNTFSLSTRAWGTWASVGGNTNKQPLVVSTPSANRLDLFVVGIDSELFHMAFPGGAPSGAWDSAGGILASIPAVVSDGTGVDVVVQGNAFVGTGTGPVFFNRFSFTTASWAGWQFLNGQLSRTPSLAIDSAGTLRVVGRGQDGQIYTTSKPATGVFGAWTNLGGSTTGRPIVTAVGTSMLIVVRGGDNHVFSNLFNGSTFSGWTRTSAIAVAGSDPFQSSAQ